MQYASSFRIFRLIFSDNFRLLSKEYAQFLIRSVRIFHIKFRQSGCSDSINFRLIASQGNRLLQEKTSFLIINFLFQSWSKTFPNRWGLFSHKDLVFNEQSLLCKYTAKICPFNSVVWAAIVCISCVVLSVVDSCDFVLIEQNFHGLCSAFMLSILVALFDPKWSQIVLVLNALVVPVLILFDFVCSSSGFGADFRSLWSTSWKTVENFAKHNTSDFQKRLPVLLRSRMG